MDRGCARGHSPDRRSPVNHRCLDCRALRKATRKAGAPPPPPPDAYEVEVLEELPPDGGERWPRPCEKISQPVVDSPAVHTSRTRREAVLVISDTQEPYAAQGSIAFCLAVAREFGVPIGEPGSVYHVGDEADQHFASRFAKSPEAPHAARQELDVLRERMRAWYAAFPHMRLCRSNHGDRIVKRAAEVGLPEQLLRAWRDVIEAPRTWEWAPVWRVNGSRAPWMVEHGHAGPSGVASLRTRPALNGISTVWGHTHAQPGIAHVQTAGQRVWGLCVGSLIDRDAVAFEYGRGATWHPVNGVGVILDGGRVPVWIPWGGQWP